MQFAATLTEYILPGVPITFSLAYATYVCLAIASGDSWKPITAELSNAAAVVVGIALLGVSYMVGVLFHCQERPALRGTEDQIADKEWSWCGRYTHGLVDLLGPHAEKKEVDNMDRAGKVRRGWVLLRMRYFVLQHSASCGEELLRLQAIARAVRGARALPPALAVVLATAIAQSSYSFVKTNRPSLAQSAAVVIVPAAIILTATLYALARKCLLPVVEEAYKERWRVLCRASVAAFISCAMAVRGGTHPPAGG